MNSLQKFNEAREVLNNDIERFFEAYNKASIAKLREINAKKNLDWFISEEQFKGYIIDMEFGQNFIKVTYGTTEEYELIILDSDFELSESEIIQLAIQNLKDYLIENDVKGIEEFFE